MKPDVNDKYDNTENWVPEIFPIPSHWVYADFEAVFENISLNGIKVPQKEYLPSGQFPIIDQGIHLIGGYTNDATKVLYLKRGSIVFGDHTKCFKYVTFDFAPGADGIKVLAPRSPILERYAYYACKALRLPDRGYSRHYSFLKKTKFPLPPVGEQYRIVAKIEELFSELDKGIESLKTAREQLKVYRQAVLKHAFEGKLTAQWREENKGKLESPEQLLARIRREREARYQQQFREWRESVEAWQASGKSGKNPSKPRRPTSVQAINSDDLPTLPNGWLWLQYGDLCSDVRNGISEKPKGDCGAKIFRISAVRPMEFDTEDVRYIDNSDGRFDEYLLRPGDLVFTRYNGSRAYVGVCAEYKSDGTHLYPDKLVRTRLAISSAASGYFEKALNCGASRNFIEARIRTTAGQSGVSGSDIKGIPVPVCCNEEQKLINAGLEQALSAISHAMAEIDENLQKAETLRQSILKKTFSGQLVPQDPNDEPASALLERIRAEKTSQPKRGKRARTSEA